MAFATMTREEAVEILLFIPQGCWGCFGDGIIVETMVHDQLTVRTCPECGGYGWRYHPDHAAALGTLGLEDKREKIDPVKAMEQGFRKSPFLAAPLQIPLTNNPVLTGFTKTVPTGFEKTRG